MDIECKYIYHSRIYACKISNQKILPDTKLEFIGMHKDGKTDSDVKLIRFQSCSISKVPQGLTDKFPNLQGLEILNCGLKKIKRSDLHEYKNFQLLFFSDNKIKYLPGDLFADCKKLIKMGFGGNPLRTIEPNILNGLENLNHVDFEGRNINYGDIVSESTIARDDPKLLEMKETLYKKYMKTGNPKLKADFVKKLCRKVDELTKLKSFYQTDEVFKDFSINIGEKQFRIHKTLLAARSSYFAEIMRESPESKFIELSDIPVDIFEDVLKFLYTDELSKEANFMQLLAAADRLKIDELKEYAAKKILEQLDYEKAPEVLSLGSKYKHDDIKRKAFQKIKRKYSDIELKEEWLNDDEKVEKMIGHLKKLRKMEKDLVDSMVD